MRSFITLALAATAFAVRQAPPEEEASAEATALKDQKFDSKTGDVDSEFFVNDWNESDTDNYQSYTF